MELTNDMNGMVSKFVTVPYTLSAMVKVECPKCKTVWWTNIRQQPCIKSRTYCRQLVDTDLHEISV